MDLAVDEQGLWALWGDTDNARRLYASKIDVYSNAIILYARLDYRYRHMRDSFIFISYLSIFVEFNLSDFNNREQQKTTLTKFKGVVSRLSCKFISLLTPITRPFLQNEICEITCKLQNHSFVLKQTCLPSIIANVTETIK